MSTKQCCSLCCTVCERYRFLQNEKGESNDIYEITVKYFDPMLFTYELEDNKESGQDRKVLCQECWFHIENFYEFQQKVIKSRASLEVTIELNRLQVEVKNESCQPQNNKEDCCESCDYNHHLFRDVNIKSDNEDMDNNADMETENISANSYNEDEYDDKKPLNSFKITKNMPSKNKENECFTEVSHESNAEKLEEKPKVRRGRKPKSTMTVINKNDTANSKKIESKRKKLKLIDNQKKGKMLSNLEKGLESDTFIAEWKPDLECDLCGVTSPTFQNLRLHFKEKHKTRGYIKCCERKFYRRYVLVEHIRMHINPELHKCDICGKHSSSQYNLKLHKKIMHENTEQFECPECHKMFNQKPTLERHMLTHVTGSKDFVCQECGKAYVLELQLKSHIKTVHNVDRVCDQCGKIVHGKPALKKHMMEHAGIEKPKFPCEECGTVLNSRNSLKRHMAAFHHDGTTIYVCSICGKVASSENALLTHKKHVHEEKRKHKCTYCDKAFKRPKVLREHIATHTGQDLYQCPHCPQTFKVSANMHHHRKKVHLKEWEEGRKNRLQLPKVNINQVKHQVVV